MDPDPALLMVMQNPDTGFWIQSLLIFILLMLSAMISACEVAYFSLSPASIESVRIEKSGRNLRILDLLSKPKRLLATILIFNNTVNVAIAIISSTVIDSIISFDEKEWLIRFLIQVIGVTLLILLVGEITPKVYATQNSLKVAAIMSMPLIVLRKLLYPFSSILVKSNNYLDKKIKKKNSNITVDELGHALELTYANEKTSNEEKKILEGIVRFGNTDVKQIMKSRMDIVAFDYQTNFKVLIDKIIESGFSRVPIFDETIDNVKGVLYIKDLLPYIDEDENFEWQKLLREAFYVPENKMIDDLLKEFKETKIHLAIVVDEYGGTNGIVTLEDVLEEIVGDITDEFDDERIIYTRIDKRNYLFEGKTPLIDIYRILEIDGDIFEEAKGESDTLAGFLLEQSGKMPIRNEKIKFEKFLFTIESVDKRRIKSVKVTLPNEESNSGTLSSFVFILFLLFFASCQSESVVPKPRGYMRVHYPEKSYHLQETNCPYTFEIPDYTYIQDKQGEDVECFKDIVFKDFRAILHLTYKPILNDSILGGYMDDSHNMAYDHVEKADDINKEPIFDTVNNVFGILYNIEGNAASNIQFFITDSTHHFLRGALYFNHRPNYDSLLPAINFIKEDIWRLIKTIQWSEAVKVN